MMAKYKILIIICSVFLTVSVGCTVYGYLNKDKNVITQKESESEVYPDFKNYEVSQIVEFANKNNIKLSIVHKNDNTYPKGTVLYQTKEAGKTVLLGDSLTVYISNGNENYTPPIINNDTEEIEEYNEESIESEYSDEIKDIGILIKEYYPFDNFKFQKNINANDDGKVTIENDKIVYQDFHIDGKKKSIKAPNAVSAAIICDCGSCGGIYYINNKNELFFIDLYVEDSSEIKAEKIASNIKELGDLNHEITPSTCGSNEIVLKDINDKLYVINYDGEYDKSLQSLKEVERSFVVLAGENGNEWERIVYVVSENAKVDTYLKDENEKTLNAKCVINDEDDFQSLIYVIDENNYLYVFEDYIHTPIGKKYNSKKVKTYDKTNDGLNIVYEDEKTENIKGTVWTK